METKQVINLRGFDCLPEVEEKFTKWYGETHIPMLLKSGWIKEVTWFRRVGDAEDYPKYVVIYEFKDISTFNRYEASQELAAAIEDTKRTWAVGSYKSKWRVQYEVVQTWKGSA